MVDGLGRARLAVYAAVGVVLLLLGVDAVRGGGASGSAAAGGEVLAEDPVVSGSGGAARGQLVVHVAGAVRKPGVYGLAAGSRVADAIERAGGPDPGALTERINLAARLADGQQVVVPDRDDAPGGSAGAGTGAAADGPISLGSASAAELEQIDGIGPVTAGKIIEFRDQNGGVASLQELEQIHGIGPATLEALSSRLQP